jgi:DNA-binding NarL/FixJ family response regulator
MLVTASWVIADPLATLSPRQLDIAKLIADGFANKRIAHELCIAETTVEVHVKGILRRLGVKNRTEIASILLRSS